MFEWWWKAQRARDHARSNMHARVLWPVKRSRGAKGGRGGEATAGSCAWDSQSWNSASAFVSLALCTDYRPMQKYLCVWVIEIQSWHKSLTRIVFFINIWICSANFVYRILCFLLRSFVSCTHCFFSVSVVCFARHFAGHFWYAWLWFMCEFRIRLGMGMGIGMAMEMEVLMTRNRLAELRKCVTRRQNAHISHRS